MRPAMQRWVAGLVCAVLPASFVGQTLPAVTPPPVVAEQPQGDVPQRVVLPVASSVAVRPRQHAKAERLYLQGAKLMEDRHFSEAETAFAKAAALDPTRREFLQGLALAQEHRITSLLQQSAQVRTANPTEADRLMAQARGIDPQNPRVLQHDAVEPRAIAQLRLPSTRQPEALAGPMVLQPTGERHSFHLNGDRREMARQIAQAYGLVAANDIDLKPKTLRLDVDDVDYATAQRIFSLASDVFATPLDEHTVLFAEDNAANRARLEHLVEEVLPLPGYTAEQITDAANMVKSVFDLKQVSFEPQLGAIAVRAPADTVDVINGTLADLLDTGSEVTVDVKLYAINSEKIRNQGVSLPSSLGAFDVRSEATSIVSANQTLVNQLIANGVIPAGTNNTLIAAYLVFVAGLGTSSNLKNTFLLVGGGLTQAGLTAGSFPVLNIALQQSDARELDDVQLRIGDRGSATVKSGTRYPIQTSLFSDIATSSTSSLAGVSVNGTSLASLLSQYLGTSSLGSSATIPQIQYEDLGVVLKAEPHVQRGGTVAMHLEVKITALSGSSLNGIPVLQSRQFSSDLTVGDGETALMASNVTESELRAASGIPGLSELPGFQSGTSRLTDTIKGNLVVLVTPHIVRHAHRMPKGPYLPVVKRPEPE